MPHPTDCPVCAVQKRRQVELSTPEADKALRAEIVRRWPEKADKLPAPEHAD